jgi:uncharacterized membrane protein YjgN (DUF898 family)
MSRTSLRGIRFSFRGDLASFLKMYIPSVLSTIITFGICAPLLVNNIMRFYCDNAHYGNAHFQYDGKGRDLLVPWTICLLLAPFTLGFSLVHFNVRWFNYKWNHVSFEGARFLSNAHVVEYCFLVVTNTLLKAMTFGFGYPWLILRLLHFHFEQISLRGEIQMDRITQEFNDVSPAGEGGASLFDAGPGLDF